jgi:hypothetical protein
MIASRDEELAHGILKEQEHAAGLRGQWEFLWEQIARRILPSYVLQFSGQNRSEQYPGQPFTEEMVDATGANALMRFGAVMESMLTPRSTTWHVLEPSDAVLLKDRATRLWFEEATRMLFRLRYAPTANYASQKHEDYLMLGAFGTGALYIDALRGKRERGLRYRAVHLGQNYFMENHQGLIDTNYRRFPYTARQAVQHFGADRLPETIVKDAEDGVRSQKIHWFVHKVAPRPEAEYDPDRVDAAGMPWKECYVSVTEKRLVSEGGFFTFPYAISRYMTTPGDTYGRSPALLALPSIKTLNEIKKTLLKQGHRSADPILLAHDDGVLDSVSLKPGSLIPGGITADGRALIQPLPIGNPIAGKDQADEERRTINDFFLVTLFQILVETPEMTATEVVERAREKGSLLSPTMGRQQSESLGPQIEREIDLAVRLKFLPPMPPALVEAGGAYNIRYDSPLSRMARAEEASGGLRTIESALSVAEKTQNMEPLDHFDWDTIIPELADINGMPVRWRNSMPKVLALRQGRAKQAEMQSMIEAAPAASNMLKTLMPTPPAGRA